MTLVIDLVRGQERAMMFGMCDMKDIAKVNLEIDSESAPLIESLLAETCAKENGAWIVAHLRLYEERRL